MVGEGTIKILGVLRGVWSEKFLPVKAIIGMFEGIMVSRVLYGWDMSASDEIKEKLRCWKLNASENCLVEDCLVGCGTNKLLYFPGQSRPESAKVMLYRKKWREKND